MKYVLLCIYMYVYIYIHMRRYMYIYIYMYIMYIMCINPAETKGMRTESFYVSSVLVSVVVNDKKHPRDPTKPGDLVVSINITS